MGFVGEFFFFFSEVLKVSQFGLVGVLKSCEYGHNLSTCVKFSVYFEKTLNKRHLDYDNTISTLFASLDFMQQQHLHL